MNTPIHDFLRGYSQNDNVRAHMPAHIGTENPIDITEISGADSLFEADGIIAESERNAASLFRSAATFYSCGGSTLAVQSMLTLAKMLAPFGKNRVTAARYSHRSFIDTAVLLGFETDWVYPDEFLSCKISPADIEKKITPQTFAVFINSIDYYGGMSDIEGISAVCERHCVPLLVDNAHGAYLTLTDSHPITRGASMTADSAHKTLPCLTGGAYLHIADDRFIPRAREASALYGSSSPSYLILDSLDRCNIFLENGQAQTAETTERIRTIKNTLVQNQFLLRESDAMRITIDANAIGYTGTELSQALEKAGIFCEMADTRYLVLLFSPITPKEWLDKITETLLKIEKKPPVNSAETPILKDTVSVLPPRKACFSNQSELPLSCAVGKICAQIVSPCPPCIPMIMPGERITETAIALLARFGVKSIRAVL